MLKPTFLLTSIFCMAITTAAFGADSTTTPSPGAMQHAEHVWNPANMEEHFARQMDKFKTLLQLTANQESAWAKWSAAIKPQAPASTMPEQAAFEKMSTPERLDTLHAIRTQRNAEMDRHEQATKDFYAVLTQPQRKVFDLESLAMLRHNHRHHGGWGHQGGTNSEVR